MMTLLHGKGIFPRRQRVLSTLIGGLLPATGDLLDIGFTKLALYPVPADWLFGRSLHSIVLLEKNTSEQTRTIPLPIPPPPNYSNARTL
jgi:hypothetical protein